MIPFDFEIYYLRFMYRREMIRKEMRHILRHMMMKVIVKKKKVMIFGLHFNMKQIFLAIFKIMSYTRPDDLSEC